MFCKPYGCEPAAHRKISSHWTAAPTGERHAPPTHTKSLSTHAHWEHHAGRKSEHSPPTAPQTRTLPHRTSRPTTATPAQRQGWTLPHPVESQTKHHRREVLTHRNISPRLPADPAGESQAPLTRMQWLSIHAHWEHHAGRKSEHRSSTTQQTRTHPHRTSRRSTAVPAQRHGRAPRHSAESQTKHHKCKVFTHRNIRSRLPAAATGGRQAPPTRMKRVSADAHWEHDAGRNSEHSPPTAPQTRTLPHRTSRPTTATPAQRQGWTLPHPVESQTKHHRREVLTHRNISPRLPADPAGESQAPLTRMQWLSTHAHWGHQAGRKSEHSPSTAPQTRTHPHRTL